MQLNPRFATYCPFCQISTAPSSLPQGLRDPPSYNTTTMKSVPGPPPYSVDASAGQATNETEYDEKNMIEDTLHFVDHDSDSIHSLSLRYGVPTAALRRKNNITSDHLLQARKTILIPGEYYREGVSLSPQPIHGEEEELRKSKIRRFMTTCKVADYEVASLYLEQANHHLQTAIEAYVSDEAWERAHPQAGHAQNTHKRGWRR